MPTVDLTLALLARAVADDSNKPINQTKYEGITCPKPLPDLVGTGDPLFGPGTPNFHTFMIYLSAPALFLTLLSSIFLTWKHLHSYTSPQEQRQILRVVNLPLAYALFNFLALTFTLDYMYIEPLGGVYEAFAVAALFLLILEYIAPDGTDREAFFAQTEMRGRGGKVTPGGSLVWYKTTYASVMQYPLLKTIIIVIQIVTQYFGDFCESSFSPKYAHLWLTLADYLFVGGALGATIKFSLRFKKDYPEARGRQKVWTFLGIIFFQIIQDLLFHLLNGKLFHPTHKLTYNDLNFGLASLLTCLEALFFSILMHWSFSATTYAEGTKQATFNRGAAKRTSTFRAILDALNVADIIAGTVSAMGTLFMKILARLGSARGGAGAGGRGVGLEPLTGGRQGKLSPDWEEGETSYSYAAGYHAPNVPAMVRDPSPGRAQMYGAHELRPGVGDGYGMGYDRRVSGDVEEGMPLREARPMV